MHSSCLNKGCKAVPGSKPVVIRPTEVRKGAEAAPSNEGAPTAMAARFGAPNQPSTKAIQTCLQAGMPSLLLADGP